jgi:CspA family cold shock protein
MASRGVVRHWDADEGWGVLDAPETPGGCWAHYSAGESDLQPGQAVLFDFEEVVDQDGYRFRAVRVTAQ